MSISTISVNITTAVVSTIVASIFLGAIGYYGFLEGFAEASIEKHKNLDQKINTVQESLTEKIKDAKAGITQETKRNNIQDVSIAKNSENLANVKLSLNRIEDTLGIITDDLKDFMKETPKEMKNMRRSLSELGESVAVLRDRDERGCTDCESKRN